MHHQRALSFEVQLLYRTRRFGAVELRTAQKRHIPLVAQYFKTLIRGTKKTQRPARKTMKTTLAGVKKRKIHPPHTPQHNTT